MLLLLLLRLVLSRKGEGEEGLPWRPTDACACIFNAGAGLSAEACYICACMPLLLALLLALPLTLPLPLPLRLAMSLLLAFDFGVGFASNHKACFRESSRGTQMRFQDSRRENFVTNRHGNQQYHMLVWRQAAGQQNLYYRRPERGWRATSPSFSHVPPIPLDRRYEDMDWVRGRPPDALLYLKALIKAAPLPLPPPLTPPPPPVTAAAAADVRAAASLDDSHRGAETAPANATAGAAAAATATAAIKNGIDVPVVAAVNVSPPRLLAEGALLGPLGDVGTIAGALRGKIGGNLREMAAARCVGASDWGGGKSRCPCSCCCCCACMM